jgi:hypothetical protein
MKNLKAFSENLSYKLKPDNLDDILKQNKYKRMSKGGKYEKIMLFGDGNEILFNYNNDTKTLTVLKQGWQLMNIKRGF